MAVTQNSRVQRIADKTVGYSRLLVDTSATSYKLGRGTADDGSTLVPIPSTATGAIITVENVTPSNLRYSITGSVPDLAAPRGILIAASTELHIGRTSQNNGTPEDLQLFDMYTDATGAAYLHIRFVKHVD